MKLDRRIVILFLPPLAACLICLLTTVLMPKPVMRAPARPDFLNTIDHLSMVTAQAPPEAASLLIKDIFRREWKATEEDLAAPAPVKDETPQAMAEPVHVSMIVEEGKLSFCIVDGRKMHAGDANERFRVLSIGQDRVTLQYTNGTRETYHVKPY